MRRRRRRRPRDRSSLSVDDLEARRAPTASPMTSDWRAQRSSSARMSSRLATPRSTVVARGEPQLVDAVDVRRGRRPRRAAARRRGRPGSRRRAGACGAARARPRRARRALPQVDEREAVAAGERPRDALGWRDALVEERLGERAGAGAPAGRGEPVARQQLRRREQLGDEIGDRLEPDRAAPRAGSGPSRRDRRDSWTYGVGRRARSSC